MSPSVTLFAFLNWNCITNLLVCSLTNLLNVHLSLPSVCRSLLIFLYRLSLRHLTSVLFRIQNRASTCYHVVSGCSTSVKPMSGKVAVPLWFIPLNATLTSKYFPIHPYSIAVLLFQVLLKLFTRSMRFGFCGPFSSSVIQFPHHPSWWSNQLGSIYYCIDLFYKIVSIRS